MWHIWQKGEVDAEFWWGNMKKATVWKTHSGRIILKRMLSIIGGHGRDYRDEAGCCEHVNESSFSINC
jgi:hypothetical protein